MKNNQEEDPDEEERPLALLIRAKRQWHGTLPMTQKELARRTGMTVRQLKHYETVRELPRSLKALLVIASALELRVDDLIAPWHKRSIQGRIAGANER